MEQLLQTLLTRAATRENDEPQTYRNFLIIVPEPADERVTVLAHRLNDSGNTYVARYNQKQMEDDASGVRYLPLGEALPSFGILTAVIVIRDPVWAARAAATYPETDIFLLGLPPCPDSGR